MGQEREREGCWVDCKRSDRDSSLTWHDIATGEGITREPTTTLTQRTVIAHTALGIDATGAWAGILTTLIDARLFGGAFGAQHTLGSTIGGQAYVEFKAGADSLAIELTTLRIGSTG